MNRREFICGGWPHLRQGLKLHRPLITPHSFRDRILVTIYAQDRSVIMLFCPSSVKWPMPGSSSW
jgi:hypothetical protein